ncbi:hypothetical protein KEM55_004971, partial [Ascosphaera atra]
GSERPSEPSGDRDASSGLLFHSTNIAPGAAPASETCRRRTFRVPKPYANPQCAATATSINGRYAQCLLCNSFKHCQSNTNSASAVSDPIMGRLRS